VAGPSIGVHADSVAARLSRVGRVFLKQQPSGTVWSPRTDQVVSQAQLDAMAAAGADQLFSEDVFSFFGAGGSSLTLKQFEFPFGPKEITYEGAALDYQEIQRPGLKPILKSVAPKLRRVALSAVIADRASSGLESVEDQIALLEGMAQDDLDLSFVHGGVHLGYLVRLTALTVTSLERTVGGEITRAMVDINFQESSALNFTVVNLEAITAEPITPDEVPPEEEGDPSTGLDWGSTSLLTSGRVDLVPQGASATGEDPVGGSSGTWPPELDHPQ